MLARFGSSAAALALSAALVSMLPLSPATAQGLLELLFGGFRSRPQPTASAPVDSPVERPHVGLSPRPVIKREHSRARTKNDEDRPQRSERQQGPAFCVRLCDGRYFPLSSHQDHKAAAESCSSLCPASPTRVFYGNEISEASDRQGNNYSDIPNALLYRKQLVPGCTCDGRQPVGLARLSLDEDKTLRKGDLVALPTGLMVYNGDQDARSYTPIDRAKVSKQVRKEVSGVRVVESPGSVQTSARLPRPRQEGSELRTSAAEPVH